MARGLAAMNLSLYGDQAHKMTNVVGVYIPDGVNGDGLRAAMLTEFGIEIGTSFGPLHGKVWRIGTMGYNARKDAVLNTLAALDNLLRRARHRFTPGAGVDAALDVYAGAGHGA
jgi:(S)-ureidoglycine-glyoxylate aminotransferase